MNVMGYLSQSNDVLRINRAGERVHIVRVLVRLGAVGVTGLTGSGFAARIARLDREATLDEFRRRIQVDRRHIPVERVRVNSVFKLKHAVLVLGRRKLDRDAATVGVGLPFFAVGTTAGGKSLHTTGVGGGCPQVDIRAHVVDELDVAAGAGAGVAGTMREGCGGGSKSTGDENVGENHFLYGVV